MSLPAPWSSMRRSRWTPVGLALLCGHCALTGLVAVLGVAGAGAAPLLFGVDVNYVWPPFFILGAFAWWLWSGREREDACALPAQPPSGGQG